MRYLLTFVFLFGNLVAQAAPVTWTINNAILASYSPDSAPGMLTGSFDYDADTNQYTNINITATGWTTQPDIAFFEQSYGPYTDLSGSETMLFIRNNLNFFEDRFLTLEFQAPLTNAGGVISLTPNTEAFSNGVGQAAKLISSATVSTVPIPAAVWLFASGLGLLGWFRAAGLVQTK